VVRQELPPKLAQFLERAEEVVTHNGGRFLTARGTGLQHTIICPAHDDRNPSLSVNWDHGKVLLDCKSGCETEEVLAALKLTWQDLEQAQTLVATYKYENEDGVLLYEVMRFEPKTFRQRRPDPKRGGAWINNMAGVTPVPFNLPALAEALATDEPVYIVEGEKDVQELWTAQHVIATCNHGGAGKWTDAHSEYFAGSRSPVTIVADRDKAGYSHVLKVRDSLMRVAGITADLVLPRVGKDAAEHLADGGSLSEFVPTTADELLALRDAEDEATEPDHEAKVQEQTERLRIQQEARSRLAAEGWEPPLTQGSWADQMAQPDEPVEWLIPELVFEGANVVVNAQAKSGKTSLILNVAHSLLSGDPLFGHFETKLLASGRSVAWWNAELSERQAKSWLRDFEVPRAEDFFPLHLRGHSMPFNEPQVEAWAVMWLRERCVSVWMLDPLSALFTGEENSNTEVGAWLAVIDRIKRRAGVETVFLVHHVAESSTGEDGDDPNAGRLLKGRGASRLTGWADVLWSYSGRFDEPRYLAALGRDVDMPPFGGLHMAPGSRLLRWAGTRSTPAEDRRHAIALKAVELVKGHDGPIKAGELQELLPGRKPDPKRRALTYAVQQRWLASAPGPRNSTLYSLGEVNPHRIRLSDARSENQ
jgi:hypothetical protein